MFAYLTAYVATITLFMFGKVFIDAFGNSTVGFVPPFIGTPSSSENLGAILGFAIILISPQVANIGRDIFKPPNIKYTVSIPAALGVGAGAGTRAIGGGISTLTAPMRVTGIGKEGQAIYGKGGPIERLARGFGLIRGG